jgi:hypothetical protein
MENTTYYLVFQPGSTLSETFESYQQAWEFSEQHFRDGHGVAIIEQVICHH